MSTEGQHHKLFSAVLTGTSARGLPQLQHKCLCQTSNPWIQQFWNDLITAGVYHDGLRQKLHQGWPAALQSDGLRHVHPRCLRAYSEPADRHLHPPELDMTTLRQKTQVQLPLLQQQCILCRKYFDTQHGLRIHTARVHGSRLTYQAAKSSSNFRSTIAICMIKLLLQTVHCVHAIQQSHSTASSSTPFSGIPRLPVFGISAAPLSPFSLP
eukprot:15004099-Heterocapsa_arctica.AAC.1